MQVACIAHDLTNEIFTASTQQLVDDCRCCRKRVCGRTDSKHVRTNPCALHFLGNDDQTPLVVRHSKQAVDMFGIKVEQGESKCCIVGL
jgi:hypothetical protein